MRKIDYRKESCKQCGSVGLCRNEIINVESGESRGHLAECPECKMLHNYGEYQKEQ